MEPITITSVYSTLVIFFTYFVTADFYNYFKDRTEFNEIKRNFTDIKSELENIKRTINENKH